MKEFNRRDFLKYSGVIGSTFLLGMDGGWVMSKNGSLVTLVKPDNRNEKRIV